MMDLQNYPTGCFTASKITENDHLCIGGTFMGERNLYLKGDFSAFEDLFSKAQAAYEKLSPQIEQCKSWLQACNSTVDPNLFFILHAFQAVLKKEYPNLSDNIESRNNFYSQDKPALLSDIVKGGAAQCAEIALLAHAYLNHMGIENKYVSGSIAWSREEEFPDAHCYISIPLKDSVVIYDPTNPTNSDQGEFPALHQASLSQAKAFESCALKSSAFMPLKNTLTGKEVLYGVHNSFGTDLAAITIDENGKLPQRVTASTPSAKTPL